MRIFSTIIGRSDRWHFLASPVHTPGMRISILVLTIIFSPAAIFSQSMEHESLSSAKDFLRQCSVVEKDSLSALPEISAAAFCRGFVVGFMDGVYVQRQSEGNVARERFCLSDGTTPDRILKVILHCPKERPADSDKPVEILTYKALEAAFPCETK
jgi:hypothetical protein